MFYKIPVKASAGIDDVPTGENRIEIFPNPSDAEVTIDVYLDKAQDGQLYVFDMAGRIIRTLHDGHLPEGKNHFTWDGGNASGDRAAGIYICRLVTDAKVYTGKVQIQ